MVTMVIYGIIAIALASAAGYAFLTFTSVSRQATQLQENQVRMETAASALRASLLALNGDGNLFVPAGVAGASYTQLPNTLGVIAASPWGQPYLYCPLSLTGATNALGGTAGTVTEPDGTTYAIGTYSSAITQNLPYVITSPTNVISGGSAAQTGYIAFIVSTLAPGQTMPDCSAIVYTAPNPGNGVYGGVSVPGGTVRGVTANFPFTQRVIASTDRAEIYVAGTATGNGTGQDVNDATTLVNAMALWQSLQPRLTEIYLATGTTYSTNSNFSLESTRAYAQGENTSLVIGPTPGSSGQVTLDLTPSSTITIQSNTTFQNLIVTSGANILVYKPLTLRNSTFTGPTGGTMNIYNTQLTVSDSNISYETIGGSNAGISFYNYLTAGSRLTDVEITGSGQHVTFDGANSPTSYTFANTAGSTTNLPALSLQSGYVAFGPNAQVSITATGTPAIILNAAQMSLANSLTLQTSDGNYGTPKNGAIEALDGSSVSLNGTVTVSQNGGNLDTGVFIRGSSLAVNGTLNVTNLGYSAVGSEAGTLTGTGLILLQQASMGCIEFPEPIIGGSDPYAANVTFLQIYSSVPNGSTSPDFPQMKWGMPPLLSFTGDVTNSWSYKVAQNLSESAVNPTYATNSPTGTGTGPGAGPDPFVYMTAAPTVYPATFYIDPTTLEESVRTIVNNEFLLPGLMGFDGNCGVP